ncbi:hypothetical protein ONZ45_g17554 [Pleurotus djamor]|nr:hypothetical protein ONZ45_g17554 [Pleurotus djamor]
MQAPSEPVTIAVAYSQYALSNPTLCRIVAIAEPRPKTRSLFTKTHTIDPSLVFETHHDLLAASAETISTVGKRLADAVIIAVQDQLHLEVALGFVEQGYHVLCEKPMAVSVADCVRMEEEVRKKGVIFGMGHGNNKFIRNPLLRYSPYTKALSTHLRSGKLGNLVNVVHIEPVGYYHFAHSFVRGNWCNEEESSFSLLTKSCHDIDLLCHWFAPAVPVRVSSFGSLQHFKKSEKPPSAGDARRCLDCPIERQCAYSAKKIYLDPVSRGSTSWPSSTLIDGIPDIENITHALRTGPYGLCVYESRNDVCDHQVVNIQFSNGSTASFTMVAFTSLICERQTRMHLTKGEIVGDMREFEVAEFCCTESGSGNGNGGMKKVKYNPAQMGGGHGGGDMGLMKAFVAAVREGDQSLLGTDVSEVLRSHLMVFAAEESRRNGGSVVDCVEFEREARRKYGSAPPTEV